MSKTYQTPKKSKKQVNSFKFHVSFLNSSQKLTWAAFQDNDILFLNGPAGCGKTYLSVAFAINEILNGNKKKIILTRPIVESGENLGFLPGTISEKVNPYMMPLYDSISQLVGTDNPNRDLIDKSLEIAPLAYLRGRTFRDSICIFDEAQNATAMQIKLFLTRLGDNSKMIINGDPTQSDIFYQNVAITKISEKLSSVKGIGIINFKNESIIRHSLVAKVVEKLADY